MTLGPGVLDFLGGFWDWDGMLQFHKIIHDSRFLFFKGLDLVRLNLGTGP